MANKRFQMRAPLYRKAAVGLGCLVAMAALAVYTALPESPEQRLERQGETFVRLALALGRLHPDEIDAYFGPAALDSRDDKRGPSLADIEDGARSLLTELQPVAGQSDDTLAPRSRRLAYRLEHFITLLELLQSPDILSFEEESRELYDVTMPTQGVADEDAERIIQSLNELLPGRHSLSVRAATFNNAFVIPPDKRQVVFERALEECRRRTLQHWSLPADEQIAVEFSRDVQAAWHRYQGQYRSSLELNPLSIAFTGAAVELACHEGYPGHHAQFTLMESTMHNMPVEDTVALLRAPDSVLREGAANYGVDLIFPLEERLAFERDVLFPLAGLDSSAADKYVRANQLIKALAPAAIPILRDYGDGVTVFNAATRRLEREALIFSPEDLLEYVDRYGAYTTGYTIAHARLRDYITQQQNAKDMDSWQVLADILLTMQHVPRLSAP